MLQQAYGYDCMGQTQCYNWFSHFKAGRISTNENPGSGHPSASISDYKIDKVCTAIHKDCHLTAHEIAEELGISVGSCYKIITGKQYIVKSVLHLHLWSDYQKCYHQSGTG